MRDQPTRRPDSRERSTVFGTRGTVACKHPHAALAGIQALDDGGNIADPIVQLRVGTVEYLEASSRLATRTRQPLTHRVCCYSEHRDRRPYPAKIPALRALARLVLPFYGQRRLVGTLILTSPCTRDKHFLFVGLRFPGQLALDGGLVEANEALAAYLDDRSACLAGLFLYRAGGRRVAFDVYRPLQLLQYGSASCWEVVTRVN